MSVRFERVSKTFGDTVALRDFSLDIDDGEFVVLLLDNPPNPTMLSSQKPWSSTIRRSGNFASDLLSAILLQ